MSDKLLCPFCQQELVEIRFGEQRYWTCINDKCDKSVGLGGNKKLWQELIRTRKALDVAVDAIKNATEYLGNQEPIVDVMAMNLHTDLSKALEQITALEQKD